MKESINEPSRLADPVYNHAAALTTIRISATATEP